MLVCYIFVFVSFLGGVLSMMGILDFGWFFGIFGSHNFEELNLSKEDESIQLIFLFFRELH